MNSSYPAPLSSIHSQTLDLPPSCAQFCPAHPEYLVVGTYNLQADEDVVTASDTPEESGHPKQQNRNGSLVVMKMNGDELDEVQVLSQPSALLDLRFYSAAPDHQDVLAVISSVGTLAIFKLDPLRDPESPFKHVATSRCEDLGKDVLFLQCAWHPRVPRVLGVTTSTGFVRLLHLSEGWSIGSWTDLPISNSLEAWCVAFAPSTKAKEDDEEGEQDEGAVVTVYSGGDDSMLRYTTASCSGGGQGSEEFVCTAPYAACALKGQHDAGVTAILPLSLQAHDGGRVVITGSYDDHLRVLSIHDLHQSHGLKRAQLLADANLGGGVWRLDLVHVQTRSSDSVVQTRIQILASCMYAGARLVEIVTDDGLAWSCNVLARFEEHKSMNYASANVVSSSATRTDKVRVVSTSFYDKLLCVWDYDASIHTS